MAEESNSAINPRVLPVLNAFMRFMLRSPLHGPISKSVLLITFTGRKSGKVYTTPADYSRDGDDVFLFTGGKWWRNFVEPAPVTLRLRGQDVPGTAQAITDQDAIAEGLAAHIKRLPMDAKFHNVALAEDGTPDPDDCHRAAARAVMVRIALN